jgi:hypothetical protein
MAQLAETNLPTLDPYEILDLADRRIQEFQVRNQLYETYERYYRGLQRDSGQPSILAANSQGRPLLRLSETSGQADRSYSSQRLAPIVDDGAALMGRMPASRSEPPDQSEAGLKKAELLTKYLISTHELSAMDRQQAEAGFHLCGLGDACYVLEPVADIRRVTWSVVHPSTAFPSFMWGYRRFEVMDLVVRYSIDAYAARARWGSSVKVEKENKRVSVTIYLSPYQRTIVIGREHPQQVAHTPWDLGFCPAVWVFNKVNGQMANSDISQSLVQQDALDFTWAVFLDGIVQNTYPIIGVRNPVSMSNDPPVVGPGAPPIALGADGDIIVRQTQGDMNAIVFGMQALINDINAASGTSEVRQEGKMHSSIVTGRAVQSVQGPQTSRLEFKLQEVGAGIRRLNEMTLEMQEKAPYLGKHEFEIFGRYKGQSFRETMTGEDIDGWYRNSVFWEPVTGMNLQQKTAVAYEGMVAKLWDDLRAMELAGVEDPLGMRQRIAQQLQHEAELQGQLQALVQPQQGGGQPPSPGGPSGGAGPAPAQPAVPAPSQGQAAPPPTMIARPPAFARQAQQAPTGITRQAVEKALKGIAEKLKGTVWALGDLATQGQALHVQLAVSDPHDYNTVLQVARGLDPQAKVERQPESRLPKDAVRVA